MFIRLLLGVLVVVALVGSDVVPAGAVEPGGVSSAGAELLGGGGGLVGVDESGPVVVVPGEVGAAVDGVDGLVAPDVVDVPGEANCSWCGG